MENIKEYELNEQLYHIAYMFNVRTKGKKYENFIINAIYTKVGNLDLMPVTQQYVRNINDSSRYYLIDLYFPQINFGVEIDERQHISKENLIFDKEREKNIKTAIGCDLDRIPIVDKQTEKNRSYAEICEDIDRIVEKIKQKIDAKEDGIKWITNEEKKYGLGLVKNGVGEFNIEDNITYSSITEIYNICGGCRRTGEDAKKLQKCGYKLNSKYYLWVPTLTIEEKLNEDSQAKKMQEITRKTKYNNYLSEDGMIIKEINNDPQGWKNPSEDHSRVVFMRMKDMYGRSCIKFIGVFKYTLWNQNECIHERIETKIKISDLLPDKK